MRRLQSSDSLTALTRILNRAYAPLAAAGMRYVATWQGVDVTRRRVSRGECWVADWEGRLVGTIVFEDAAQTRGCDWYDRPEVASFHQFAVEPELQGNGIGGALLDRVERRAGETGAAEIALDTAEPAAALIDMYTRRGYRQVGWADWESTNYRSVILSRTVA